MSLELSSIFETMSHRYRREILLLVKHEDVETKSDVMDRMNGDRDRKKLNIALEHKHLPKLSNAGYVEYDRESGAISVGPQFEVVDGFIDLIESHSDELAPIIA